MKDIVLYIGAFLIMVVLHLLLWYNDGVLDWILICLFFLALQVVGFPCVKVALSFILGWLMMMI